MLFLVPDNQKDLKGIYCIRNIVNNKQYIGCTKNSFYNRYCQHNRELNNGKHVNDHLQKAFNYYGDSSFVFEIIEVVDDISKLYSLEKDYILKFNTMDNGYNLTSGGEGFDDLSHEARMKVGAKNRQRLLGSKLPLETRKKMSESRKGKKLNEHQKEALRKANENKVVSDEIKQKLSERFQGSNSSLAKLTECDVEQIEKMIMSGVDIYVIANQFNVCKGCIEAIKYGYKWKHVNIDGWKEYQQSIRRVRKLTLEEELAIIDDFNSGMVKWQIKLKYHISYDKINSLIQKYK